MRTQRLIILSNRLFTYTTLRKIYTETVSNNGSESPLRQPQQPQTVNMFRYNRQPILDIGDAKQATILLFPGQGSQYVGMGQELMKIPAARDVYQHASEVVGYDVARLCIEGPEKELERQCEIAVLVTSLAAVKLAYSTHSAAMEHVQGVAGFSLGEITSLVFANVIPFDQALRLVNIRMAAIKAASRTRSGGMLTVWLARNSNLPELQITACEAAAAAGVEDPICKIANYLYPNCKVLAGDTEALQYVEKRGREYGVVRVARVNVPGAYHSPLMAAAVEPVFEAARLCTFGRPSVRVISCVDARVYNDMKEVRKKIAKLSTLPVRWETMLDKLYRHTQDNQYIPFTITIGPGNALRSTLKLNNVRAWDNSVHVAA